MKKLMFGIATLVVLAGSTFSAVPSNTAFAAAPKPKPAPGTGSGSTSSSIPPPTCPPGDPNGCGIFD